jgi:hypothetical protein
MWPKTVDQRLGTWYQLRESVRSLPTEQALTAINTWWFNAPWRPYYLHWDDQPKWPDPWQLLSDDVYCDLARGLGILYTITLLDRPDLASADLVLTEDGDNLVLVDKTKYILNWKPDSVVNTFQEVKIRRKYQKHQIA